MDNAFTYHLTKYFSDYMPNQLACSAHTIRSYRDTFVQLMEFYKKKYHIPPEKLEYGSFTAQRIEEFLKWLEDDRGVGIRTRNQRLAAIHAFFRYLQYRDPAGFSQCAEVLAVPFKKAPSAPVGYMDLEETAFLFTLPDQRDDMQLRDLAFLTLLYESGARIQELIDLHPSDIRFGATNTVTLHGKGNKTRLVPISPDVAKIIRAYEKRCGREAQEGFLFVNRKGEKMTRAGTQYIIDKYVGMGRERKPDFFRNRITNHSFRHSKAMHLLEAGVNLIYIRDFLGHSSVMTTEVYARANPKIKEEQLKKNSASIKPETKYGKQEKEDLIDWLKKNL